MHWYTVQYNTIYRKVQLKCAAEQETDRDSQTQKEHKEDENNRQERKHNSNRETMLVEVPQTYTLRRLKEILASVDCYALPSPDNISSLIFNGEELAEDKTLQDYKVKDRDTILFTSNLWST